MRGFYNQRSLSLVNTIPGIQFRYEEKKSLPGTYNNISKDAIVTIFHLLFGYIILKLFPFERFMIKEFSSFLGSANPCASNVHMEPFPTSVFKDSIWIFATTTKICTIIDSIRNFFCTSQANTCSPTHRRYLKTMVEVRNFVLHRFQKWINIYAFMFSGYVQFFCRGTHSWSINGSGIDAIMLPINVDPGANGRRYSPVDTVETLGRRTTLL